MTAGPPGGIWLDRGRFELLDRIGHGGQGTVWRAYDHRLDRPVAIKECHAPQPDPGQTELLVREGKALARLRSPHVVQVFDCLQTQDGIQLVMELIEGKSLAAELRANPRPPLRDVARWIEQICRGLGDAHRARIAHRDISPGNIMLTADDRTVKIVDFGLATFVDRTGSVRLYPAVTPPYAAPERWRNERGDHRADLYSVGCILYEMLTGKTPFAVPGGELPDYATAHREQAVVAPAGLVQGVPEALNALVLELLAKDPAQRPGNARLVAQRATAAVAEHLRTAAGEGGEAGPALPSLIDFVEQGARNSAEALGAAHPRTIENRLEWAELTGLEGDIGGAVRLYRQLAADCAAWYGQYDRRTLNATTAMARWITRADPPGR
jgi:serine/threonine protein kinase